MISSILAVDKFGQILHNDYMAGMFDFFKKKPADEGGNTTNTPQTNNMTKTQVSSTQTQTVSRGGAYSGIGNPPSGKAYSGIGNPSSGQAYSGIGNPPSGQAYSDVGNPPVAATAPSDASTIKAQTPAPAAPQPPTPEKDKVDNAQQQASTQTTDKTDKNIDQQKQNDQKTTSPLGSNIDGKKRESLDLMTHLTHRSNTVFMEAQKKAVEYQSQYIDSEHLLHGLITDSEIYKFFTDIKILPQIIEEELGKIYQKANSQGQPQPSPRVKKILDDSLVTARKLGFDFISPEHILLSLYNEGEGAGARLLAKLGLKKEDLNKKILGKKEDLTKEGEEQASSRSTLEQYTIDLTAKAAQGLLDPVVERSEVIERVIHILSRRSKNNPALIGEAGVGKTAIVEGLAHNIASKKVPETLLDKKVLQLDLMSLIAGASHRGEFEERMKKLIEEIVASKGKIILFIDEIHNLVGAGAGGEGALDASNFLKPSLARGELQVVGATTLTEYRKYIEKDPALERRFQTVLVPEPTVEQAIKMLKSLKDKYEAFHKVKIPDEAIESAVKLSKRYVGERFLPDKAVDLMDEAASAVRLPMISLPEEMRSLEERIAQLNQEIAEAKKSGNRVKVNILTPKLEKLQEELKTKKEIYDSKKSQTTTEINSQIIKDIVARWTGIPVSKISESEVEKLTQLEDIMHKRLINQEIAVSSVAQAVRRGRAGLKSTKRPIGSFVFLGPTGVGKTELAKTLAEILFGQDEAMIRLDMTEFMEKHEVAKLLGAPPGYVGYEEGGKLTEAVRRKPYSVVLFDEVEKAHPDIFNILLQILDDGRLTDNKGHTISFKNTVVICTSNIGTNLIQDEIMASGKMEIEEPTLISTYTFSPRGREILTIIGKIFEKEPVSANARTTWSNSMLLDYFSGQKIDSQDENEDKLEFPISGFDTHAISPKGVELISQKDKIYYRTSTTNKVWNILSLIDYFKDQVVINALPDAPEQQLPTNKLKTHAFSPDEFEIVSNKDRFWRRKSSSTNWETGLLKDYFKDQTIQSEKYKQSTINNQQSTHQDGDKTDNINDAEQNQKPSFPTNYWDIHTFSPTGKEIIIVGQQIWTREPGQTAWAVSEVNKFFGKDFPLEKEIDEKKKTEEELDKNKYQIIKSKVMTELRKFFRPELINRFDEVIIFEPLKYEHMLKIVELQLKSVKELLEEQNIGFSWTIASQKEIARAGFDPIYGARPLKRTIQKLIENPISTLIIQKKVNEGDMIVVDFDGENFVFNIEKIEMVAETDSATVTIKKYFCEACGNHFTTLYVKNSTIICPKCVSKKVQEEIETKEETLKEKSEDNKQTIDDPENKTQANEEKILGKNNSVDQMTNSNKSQSDSSENTSSTLNSKNNQNTKPDDQKTNPNIISPTNAFATQ